MSTSVRIVLALMTSIWLQHGLCGEKNPDDYEECIQEPIFEGKVCTVQAHRDASVGVLLIHGLGGSVDDWRNTLPELAKNFHVVAFDLPGFGKSDKGSELYSPTSYARLAAFLADRYFASKPYYVVGHSMGGAIALRFAAQRPLRFQRLVLIDPAGILHPLVLSEFTAGSLVEHVSGIRQTRGVAERISGRILELADKLPIQPADIVNSSLGRDVVLRGGPEKIAALALASEDFGSAISSVTEPTLILWGDHDQTVPVRTGEVLAARMPHARLEIIRDAAHEPMNDQSDVVNALLDKYLLSDEQMLAEQFKKPQPKPVQAKNRVGICSHESNIEFRGDYASIKVQDCSNVTIRNARIGHLAIVSSRVTIFDTDITGQDKALSAENSDVTITNGDISGVIAINSVRSRFDLAGVHLKGSRDAVKAVGSKLVFSVSQISSPHYDGEMHDFKRIEDGVL